MPGQIVGITGHRPDKLGGWKPCPEWDIVHHNIRNTLLAVQPRVVISGMGLGVDQWTAEICHQLQIPFVAFVPYPDWGSNWPPRAQQKYEWLLTLAHQIVMVCPDRGYAPWKVHQRNRWVVDKCELLLAVYNGTPGGTQNTLAYATQVHREIQYIPIGFPQEIPQVVPQFGAPGQPEPAPVQGQRPAGGPVSPRITRIIEE